MYITPFFPRAAGFSHYLINPPVPGRQGGPGVITQISLREKGGEGRRERGRRCSPGVTHLVTRFRCSLCWGLGPKSESIHGCPQLGALVRRHQAAMGVGPSVMAVAHEAGIIMVPILQIGRLSPDKCHSLSKVSENYGSSYFSFFFNQIPNSLLPNQSSFAEHIQSGRG